MREANDRVLAALRSTAGSATAEEVASAVGARAGAVRRRLRTLAADGEAFKIRYRGDRTDHWRAAPPPPSLGTGADGISRRVGSTLMRWDRGLTTRQVAAAARIDVSAVREALERLFRDNSVIRIHHRGDPRVYWRLGEVRARPTP